MKTRIIISLAALFFTGAIFSQNKDNPPPPQNLTFLNFEPDWVEFHWDTPAIENWLHWDNGSVLYYLNLGENITYTIASRWDEASLAGYTGRYLKSIRFFPVEPAVSYTIKVWKGANAANEILSQTTSGLNYDSWNEVELNDSVLIEAGDELWFGLECSVPAGDYYPVTTDNGLNTVDGYGNMLLIDGQWATLLDTGLEGNWNVTGILNSGAELSSGVKSVTTLQGYNLYRDGSLISGPFPETYEYDAPSEPGIYEYYVTAVYDEGESMPSNSVTVLWMWTSTGENSIKDFNIYPNPAAYYLKIDSEKTPDWVSITDITGKQVLFIDHSGFDGNNIIDVTPLKEGIYFVTCKSGKKKTTKKLIIKHKIIH